MVYMYLEMNNNIMLSLSKSDLLPLIECEYPISPAVQE
jgi:hypothetical protein